MSFFDNIGKTISDVSQGAIQKGKGMADVVKFNSLISEEEKKINGLFFFRKLERSMWSSMALPPQKT